MPWYGYEGVLRALPGRAAELLNNLLAAADLMRPLEGCELYLVGVASGDGDAVRVIEIWKSKAAHDESLRSPAVRNLIAKAMPLISGSPSGTTWTPMGGKGLPP